MVEFNKKGEKIMLLALSSLISEIDKYSEEELGVSVSLLMDRAGSAVADEVRKRVKPGSRVVVLAGKGNNGGDGYAAAIRLMNDYDVTVYDVFSSGQKTDAGKGYLEGFVNLGGKVKPFVLDDETKSILAEADCIVDAIFGTGFKGEIPEVISRIAAVVSSSARAVKIAIDVPMGVNADNGSVNLSSVAAMHATVALSFVKPGLVSFPAKSYVGDIVYCDLGLPLDKLALRFDFKYKLVDRDVALSLLPERGENTSKGSFGKLCLITGSEKYRGAAFLTCEAALRGGAGYVMYYGRESLCGELLTNYPEIIYKSIEDISALTEESAEKLTNELNKCSAILIGSGSGISEGLLLLIRKLLSTEGAPLIIDADAINVLADFGKEGRVAVKEAKRRVVLTPHPLEFARLSGNDVSSVQLNRIDAARKFAAENNCILVLKGAATVITDGERVYVNSTGSNALSKAGSGDVLAGFIASLIASGTSPLDAGALSVWVHGAAADALAKEYSTFGVTPSDLPLEIARQLGKLQKNS